ncbi:MAG: transporter, family, nitrate/nitrite transporter, partial [Mycobacterium sp.]|nr:transporter, family, nitrate/nitrite transporter [Mycobacterium sp.]
MTTLTRDRNIEHWDAEDTAAWDTGGKQIAKRNLIWSIVAEHVGFSIWSIWSVMVLFMPQNVYGIDAAGKFYLVAVPTLVGAFMRIPYTIAPARFGGRNWTIVSALLLLIPTVLTLWAMKTPGTSYTTFMIVAAFAGFGGGNFASSMTNINAFYPQRLKGWALGLNAGGGNIGVPVIQLVGLLVIATVGNTAPEIVCAAYLVLIAVAALGATFFMDNLRNQKSNFGALAEALRYRHSWVMSFLYIGTFGSFIGFSFAFGQVLQINFLSGGDTAAQAALHAAQISFLGPLLGSISRPFGGKLADRIGGGRITLYTFVAMIFAAGILVATGMLDDGMKGAVNGTQMTGYVVGFILLFILSGIGNGSTYKMIPSIFEAKGQDKDGWTAEQKATWSRTMSGALIGFAGAVGALGGVFIDVALRLSYVGSAKSATNAFWVFLGFYVICAVVTWLVFLRMQSVRAVTGEDGRPRARIGRRRLNDMTSTTRTACSYCGVGCGIEVQTRFDPASGAPVIARVSGDKLHPTNFGRLCTKGATHAEMMAADEDRLVTALVRHGRGEQATSTPVDDAVAEAGRRLRAIVDEHGPDSVALYVSGQMSIEAQYLATKLAKGFLRTKHIESNSRLCMASAGTGYKQSLGADGPPGSYTDFDITNLFFVIGSNMADCHPILYLRMVDRLKAGAKLVVVDPRRTATAEKADLFLQIKPGTDLALLNGLLHLLVESGDVDHDFIAEHTEGWGPMPEFLSDYPPEVVAGITGLAEADIRTAAAMIVEAGDWMTCWTMGLNQSTHGTWNTNAICNLHLATGAICRPGSGPMSLTGQPNAMGGREMGYMGPGLPGQRAVTSAEDRGFVERKWNLPPGTIRTDVGPGTIEMFKQMADGHIKACWVICTNPVATVANRKTVIAGLECTELVITQDAYRSTATNRYADVVLPATLWAESEAVM